MAAETLPTPPPQLKAVQTYMKIAQDVERVDPIVSYWLRLYSTETALKIDRESPDCMKFLSSLIEWLENFKKSHKDSEAVTNATVGQAHYENFVMALFNKADTVDRAGQANTSTVRMFFMAAITFEAMAVFGPLTDEISQRAKYAKFKAAYIQKCLKAGVTPKPGPVDNTDLEGAGAAGSDAPAAPAASDDTKFPSPPSSSTGDNKPPPADIKPAAYVPPPDTPSVHPPPLPRPFVAPTPPTPASAPVPAAPCDQRSTIDDARFVALDGSPLDPTDIILGQKYCKFAVSALQYDDIETAVAQLEKALKLLRTGQKSD